MDNFMDKLKKGLSVAVTEAGKLTKSVAGKTSNLVDVTKLNLTLNDTERKINAIQQKIGEMVYDMYIADELSTSDFDELCGEIDAFKEEQETLKAQIAELKNAIPCTECGTNNEKGSEFCSKCGAKLKDKKNEDDDKVIEVIDIEDDES